MRASAAQRSLRASATGAALRRCRRTVAAAAAQQQDAPPPPPTYSSSSLASAKLLYAYNPAEEHDCPGHPECAARALSAHAQLIRDELTPEGYGAGLVVLTGWADATEEQLSRVHKASSLRGLKLMSERCKGGANVMVDSAPTYLTASSYASALQGAGGVLAVVDAVLDESERRAKAAAAGGGAAASALAPAGYALCRPPGHHALPSGAMGFCLVNNASVAARHAQSRGYRRVAIIDFDVHHGAFSRASHAPPPPARTRLRRRCARGGAAAGNGTQEAFWKDPEVLFVSTHQVGSYPGTGELTELGGEGGEGATVNLPLPGLSGDAAMGFAFDEVIAPAVTRFKPDLILVSAGYDAHWQDPLAGLQLRSSTYHRLCADIRALAAALCGGRVAFLLEGGYDVERGALGHSVADSWRALLGEPSRDADAAMRLQDEPLEKAKRAIREARAVHSL